MALEMFKAVLIDGVKGAPREMVLINTAVGLVLAEAAESLSEGVEMGGDAIDSGRVAALLQNWVKISNMHT